jgi:hypothetical protein
VRGQLEKKENFIDNRTYSINVENLTNGLYFITGYDEKGRQVFTQKFIKVD